MSRGPRFDPEAILRVLDKHRVRYILIGGFAAIAHGSEVITWDVDVTPEQSEENLARLSEALRDMNARIWTQPEPEGLPFGHDAESLAGIEILNLVTDFGGLDITNLPAGTTGFDDLSRDALVMRIGDVDVVVASLADVIRSKQAAGRPKDYRALPSLRRLLEEGPQGSA